MYLHKFGLRSANFWFVELFFVPLHNREGNERRNSNDYSLYNWVNVWKNCPTLFQIAGTKHRFWKGQTHLKSCTPPPSISIPNFQNLNRCVCVWGGGVSCTYNFNFNVNLVNFTWGPFITQFKKKVCWEKRRVSGGGGGLPPLKLLACIAICLCWAKLINLDAKFTIWHATFFFFG